MSVAAALLAIPCGLAGQQAEEPRVVTLTEAVELTLRADPLAVAAQGGVDAARAGLLQARGAFVPSVNLTSSYGNSSNERFDPTTGNRASESYTAQIGATYEIFSGGRRLADARSARAGVTAAEADLQARWFEAVLATTERYYEAAAAEELLVVARQRVARAERQLEFARTRLEVGNATRSDVLRAELELGNAHGAVIDTERDLRRSRLELGRRIGVSEPVRPAPAQLPEGAPEIPGEDAIATRAERSAPAVLAAAANERAAAAATRASYSGYLPSVRLTSGYDWFSFDFPPDQESWSLRVIASVPLFNGFQREAQVARARASERTAEARARDARIAVRVAAIDAAQALGAADERARIAARGVELAREDLRVQEERYQLGAATILDLLTSQVALADAEAALVRARQTIATATARLETVVGAPIADLR